MISTDEGERSWTLPSGAVMVVPTPGGTPRYTIRADAQGRPQVWNCPPMMPGEEVELVPAQVQKDPPEERSCDYTAVEYDQGIDPNAHP